MTIDIAKIATLTLATTLLLSCGKSPDARKAEAVRCDAYEQMMTQASLVGGPAGHFVEGLAPVSAGHPSADGNKLVASMQLGEQLASGLDPARAAAVATEGGKLWQKHLADKDTSAAVTFLDGCLANYDALLADAR